MVLVDEEIPILGEDRNPVQEPDKRNGIDVFERHSDPVLSCSWTLGQPRVEQDQERSEQGCLSEPVPERLSLSIEVEDHPVEDDREGDLEGGEACRGDEMFVVGLSGWGSEEVRVGKGCMFRIVASPSGDEVVDAFEGGSFTAGTGVDRDDVEEMAAG